MASKHEFLYYEFLYPKICIGAPLYTFAHYFLPGQAGPLPCANLYAPSLYTEMFVRQQAQGWSAQNNNQWSRFATTAMAGSQFDARAVASAVLAKVRAAHATEPDARAQPADTDRVRSAYAQGPKYMG